MKFWVEVDLRNQVCPNRFFGAPFSSTDSNASDLALNFFSFKLQ
jgi:hypothetical protein